MKKTRALGWVLTLSLAAICIPLLGCGEGGGGGSSQNHAGSDFWTSNSTVSSESASSELAWVSNTTVDTSDPSVTPDLWIDPNNDVGTGDDNTPPPDEDDGTPTIDSTDVETYPNGHPLSTETTEASITTVENQLRSYINQERMQVGSPSLAMNEGLQMAARAHCKHMAIADESHAKFYGLVNPELDDCADRLEKLGLNTYFYLGELLTGGMNSAYSAVQTWMLDGLAAAILIDIRYTAIGCGTWRDGIVTPVYYVILTD